MTVTPKRLPIPRWTIRTIWAGHRTLVSLTGGRRGLRTPTADTYGMLRLATTGRTTGKPRAAILAYLEDGPSLVLMAMNGWAEPEPAWFLNLQANPDVDVVMRDRSGPMRARVASREEKVALWPQVVAAYGDYAVYQQRTERDIPLVILEPAAAHA